MKNNFYNEDEKYKNLIKDLKNLPAIKTDENFEYNLLTKINNLPLLEEKPVRKFRLSLFLAPSAVMATAIILFFVFLPPNNNDENPLLSDPQPIQNQLLSGNSSDSIEKLSEKVEFSTSIKEKIVSSKPEVQPQIKTSTPSRSIQSSRSIALDEYISGKSSLKESSSKRASVVSSGDASEEFDGFFVREPLDAQTLKKYRDALDSIKNAEIKKDSLKKAGK
ncbi:MAG: hypothetical protein KF816_12025 [Melioribacteraceae bacterium]|nr:hypothetical protein [Melioribacteraceae bacterium]